MRILSREQNALSNGESAIAIGGRRLNMVDDPGMLLVLAWLVSAAFLIGWSGSWGAPLRHIL